MDGPSSKSLNSTQPATICGTLRSHKRQGGRKSALGIHLTKESSAPRVLPAPLCIFGERGEEAMVVSPPLPSVQDHTGDTRNNDQDQRQKKINVILFGRLLLFPFARSVEVSPPISCKDAVGLLGVPECGRSYLFIYIPPSLFLSSD